MLIDFTFKRKVSNNIYILMIPLINSRDKSIIDKVFDLASSQENLQTTHRDRLNGLIIGEHPFVNRTSQG